MKKLSLLALSVLICPVAHADIKEQALRGLTYASIVAGAGMIGETMRRSSYHSQIESVVDKEYLCDIPDEFVVRYLNDFLRECGILSATQVQQFKMVRATLPAWVVFAVDGTICLSPILVADLLYCFENGKNPRDTMLHVLGSILNVRGLVVLDEKPYGWGTWAAMASAWCTLSGALAAATIPNPTATKTVAAWLAVAPITIISATAGLVWLQKCTRDTVRHADQYVIDHISDPRMLEAIAEQILIHKAFDGQWYAARPSCEERAATYRAAAEKLK